MTQLDIAKAVAAFQKLEAELPGSCDKFIAEVQAAEGSTFGDFLLKHIGISDPKAAEEELVAIAQFIKRIVAMGPQYVDPFLRMILSLVPAPAPVTP